MGSRFRIAQGPGWLLAVALSGLQLVGCHTGGLGVAQGSFDFAPAREAEDPGEETALLAPVQSVRVPRSLCSAQEVSGAENQGWRIGLVYLSGKSADLMVKGRPDPDGAGPEKAVGPTLDDQALWAWGYQFQWTYGEAGTTQGLVDVVPMVMGMDESMFIPTVSVLVGLRLGGHWEFNIGPHYSPRSDDLGDPFKDSNPDVHFTGLGLAFALGYASQTESGMNWSINFSAMKAGDLSAYGITAGWNFGM